MARFAQANRVLYVEPTYSIARLPEPHLVGIATNAAVRSRVEHRAENLFILKPPRGFPGWTKPSIESTTYRYLGLSVRRAVRALGFRDAVLWIYAPTYVHAVGLIPHRSVIFDLVDDLAAYNDPAGNASTEEAIARIVRRSDLLVVTAATLRERYGDLARRVVRVPNGFDASRFSLSRIPSNPPDALAAIPAPRIGFSGTLFSLLDFDLLAHVAKTHRDASVVLLGPVDATAADAMPQLLALPNVFHIPPRPQAEVPAYVAHFDVCINPFRTGRVADSVNPLKVYEYLALGRPVVSTPMASLQAEPAAEAVSFAASRQEFSREITRCLSPGVQARSDVRRAAVRNYSWDALFETLEVAVDAALDSHP